MTLFLRGVLVGFSIAAPVGPIGLLCIRRSMAEGRAMGLATGLGAAAADACYGALAAFGLSAATAFLLSGRAWLQLGGGALLVVLGARAGLAAPAARAAKTGGRGLAGAFVSTFLLTLSNPSTILSFLAVFSALGAVESPVSMVAGVFAGSALWWLLLSHGVAAIGAKLGPRSMAWINRLSGALLIALGAWSILTAL